MIFQLKFFLEKHSAMLMLLISPSLPAETERVSSLPLLVWNVLITGTVVDLYHALCLLLFSIYTFVSFRYGEISQIMSLIYFSPLWSLFHLYCQPVIQVLPAWMDLFFVCFLFYFPAYLCCYCSTFWVISLPSLFLSALNFQVQGLSLFSYCSILHFCMYSLGINLSQDTVLVAMMVIPSICQLLPTFLFLFFLLVCFFLFGITDFSQTPLALSCALTFESKALSNWQAALSMEAEPTGCGISQRINNGALPLGAINPQPP